MTDLTRILGDNFHLGSLGAELDLLAKSARGRKKLLDTISGRLRETLFEQHRWPSDKAGRLALILWLLTNNNRAVLDHLRLRHRHEKVAPVRDFEKPTKPLFTLKHDGLS